MPSLFAHVEKRGVHPVMGENVPGRTFGLRDFVGVVDGNMVNAAAMDVKSFAQIFHRHRRAFNVPARITHAPRRIPLHDVVGLVAEPQHKIGGASLAGVNVYVVACAFNLGGKVKAGQFAVVGVAGRVKIQSFGRQVREAFFFQFGVKGDHFLNVVGGAGQKIGRPNAKPR